VLAEVHRRERDARVRVIGRGHDHRVDVLPLIEHPPEVLVARGLRRGFGEGLLPPGQRDRPGPLERRHRTQRDHRRRAFVARRRRRAHFDDVVGDTRLEGGDLLREAGERLVGVAPVHVAHRDQVLARDVGEDLASAAAHADRGDVEAVARRLEAAAEHVARHDRQAGGGQTCGGEESSTRLPGRSRHQCLTFENVGCRSERWY
jgi:hypothetical protein